MSKQELTPAFLGSVKPVHVGVYQVQEEGVSGDTDTWWYSYFDGTEFMYRTSYGIDRAYDFRDVSSIYGPMPKRWRGLARQPKE